MSANSFDPFEIDMFIKQDEPTKITDDTYYFSQYSSIIWFETVDGLLLIDTGRSKYAPDLSAGMRKITKEPIDTVIYTHGHRDHAFELDQYLLDGQDSPDIIAHEAIMDRFARYDRTSGHNLAINTRQFSGKAPDPENKYGKTYPDHIPTTLYRDKMIAEVGDFSFEIHHAKGETDDHSWIYSPEHDVLCTGDFHINVSPNAGNPQKVQRYPWEWANTLREMAACKPQHLCPGHGVPIVNDPEEIQTRLLDTADYLETIVEQTLEALNNGSPPHIDIVHEIDPPDHDSPWLAESYDEAEFIARNVVRYYGGWYTGRPCELKPAERDSLASEIADLAGDARTLATRAQNIADEGNYRLACHLADYALEAAPESTEIQNIVASIYDSRSKKESNLMAGNIYSSAADYANQGRPFR